MGQYARQLRGSPTGAGDPPVAEAGKALQGSPSTM